MKTTKKTKNLSTKQARLNSKKRTAKSKSVPKGAPFVTPPDVVVSFGTEQQIIVAHEDRVEDGRWEAGASVVRTILHGDTADLRFDYCSWTDPTTIERDIRQLNVLIDALEQTKVVLEERHNHLIGDNEDDYQDQ